MDGAALQGRYDVPGHGARVGFLEARPGLCGLNGCLRWRETTGRREGGTEGGRDRQRMSHEWSAVNAIGADVGWQEQRSAEAAAGGVTSEWSIVSKGVMAVLLPVRGRYGTDRQEPKRHRPDSASRPRPSTGECAQARFPPAGQAAPPRRWRRVSPPVFGICSWRQASRSIGFSEIRAAECGKEIVG